MPCYHPWTAYQKADGTVSTVERKGDYVRTLTLPCGQCVGCRLERSRQWAVRCMHEAQMHESNCFITLTYKGDVPVEGLRYRDFQLFLKKLRRKFSGVNIRFYMCGEYGDKNGRPHYHACLFGIDMPDKVLFSSRHGNKLYTSKILDSIWGHGITTVGNVSFESAAYVARYIMKKVTGTLADSHYNGRVPEFCRMSLKPGIGASWFSKFSSDVFPDGNVVVRGVSSRSPRYYEKVQEKLDSEVTDMVKYKRYLKGIENVNENSDERLQVREKVAIAKVNLLKRSIGE